MPKKAPAKSPLLALAEAALADLKAEDVKVLNVSGLTTMFDHLLVASARSQKHLSSVAEHVALKVKEAGYPPLSLVGLDSAWGIVDFGDVVVHVMLPEARALYQLENFWMDLNAQSGRRRA